MRARGGEGVFILILVGLLLVGPIAPSRGADGRLPHDDAGEGPTTEIVHESKLGFDVRGRIAASLWDATDVHGLVTVVIHTTNVPVLAAALEGFGARRTAVSDGETRSAAMSARPWGAVGRPVTMVAQVPREALAAIAFLEGVVYVDDPEPQASMAADDEVVREERAGIQEWRERSRSGVRGAAPDASPPTPGPLSWGTAREHRAWDVWQLGYEGDGVNVAVLDTGVDFGHPALQGRWAVDDDPASPWFGWPIAAHLASLEGLTGNGWWTAGSDLDRLPLPYWLSTNDGDSWYTNTDYTANDTDLDGYLTYAHLSPDPLTGNPQYTPRANPQQYGNWGANYNTRLNRQYFVGCASPGPCVRSQSGLYRLGVHRDDTLTGLYGEKVGVLLVDSATPGVYDTVYVDLNFNSDFTDDKPVTRADPIATADIYDAIGGGPGQDGVADVSGGLLYFIAQSNPVSDEAVIPSIVGGEVQANLRKWWDFDGDGTPEGTGASVDVTGWFTFEPASRLWLDSGTNRYYLPGETEVLYEEYTATGSDNGVVWSLGGPLTAFGPWNFLTMQPVDTATLLRGPPDLVIESLWDVQGTVSGPLSEGSDFWLNYDTGAVTFQRDLAPGEGVYVLYQIRSYLLEPVSGGLTFLVPLSPALTGWSLRADYDVGLPIPYSQVYGPAHGYDTFIPGNGDLVAFFGEFDYQHTHGTAVAASVAARPFGNLLSPGFDVFGTAPLAGVVGIASCCSTPGPVGLYASVEENREFAALGYDGIPDSGDEAVVLVNAFGKTQTIHTGLSWDDRWLLDYSFRYPHLTTVASSGDTGPGYGTVVSPGSSPGVISVGSGQNQNYRVAWGFDGGVVWGETPSCPPPPFDPKDCVGSGAPAGPYGDVSWASGRGPSLLGAPKPDVISAGTFATQAVPVNMYCFGIPTDCDGNRAFDVASGSTASVPTTAGIVALMVEAYRSAHGGANPTNVDVRHALKAGADDMRRDVLQQGAGWANALRSVDIMREMDGITTSLDAWVPGGYQGVSRPAFPNFLLPGGTDAATVTLTNHNPFLTKNIQISDAVYELALRFEWSFSLPPGTGQFYILKPSGVYDATGALLQPAVFLPHWDTADFAKITFAYNATAYPNATTMRLDTFDWFDADGDGIFDGFSERNRITVATVGTNANSVWDTLFDLGGRIHDGLALNPRSGAVAAVPATLIVEFYAKVDWSLVSSSTPSINIPAGASASFSVGAFVPPGMPAGSYQGALHLWDSTTSAVTVVPILINVPLTGPPLELGVAPPRTSLYENSGVVQGSRVTSPWRQTGDNRLVYLLWDPGAPAPNRKMIYTALLQGPRSEPEIYAFSLAADTTWTDPAIYGPGTMTLAARTNEQIGRTITCLQPEPRVVTLEPTTPCPPTLYREFLKTDVPTGNLFAVLVRSWGAKAETEAIRADFGVMETNPIAFNITAPGLQGSEPFTVWSNSPLYEGLSAVRFAQNRTFLDDVVANPDYYDGSPYDEWLCRQTPPNRVSIPVGIGTSGLTVHITSPDPADDHDLGLWRDENGNGACDYGTDTLVTYRAGPTSDETIFVSNPAQGTYLALVGLWSSVSNMFDMEILRDGLSSGPFAVTGPTQTVPPDTIIDANLTWDLPPGTPPGTTVSGVLSLGPGLAPLATTQQITVQVTYAPGGGPQVTGVSAVPDPQEQYLAVNVSATATGATLAAVYLNVTYPDGSWTNDTMMQGAGATYYLNRTYDQMGAHPFAVIAVNATGASATATGSFTIVPPQPPVITSVNAAPDPQQVLGSVTVTATIRDAHGVASAALEVAFPDASVATYGMLRGPGDTWSFARAYDQLGGHGFRILAVDAVGASSEASGAFTVVDTVPPSANAGPDQTVPQGTVVTFDGSASQDDFRIDSYMWTFTDGAPVTLTGVQPTYPFDNLGTFPVTLTVIDAAGNAAQDSMSVTVLDIVAPVISTAQAVPSPAEVPGTTNVSFAVTERNSVVAAKVAGYRPDGSLEANATAQLDAASGRYYVVWSLAQLGSYRFVLYAEDQAGNWGASEIAVLGRDTMPPQVLGIGASPSRVHHGTPVVLWADVTDPFLVSVSVDVRDPGGNVIASLPMAFNPASGRYEASVTPVDLGAHTFHVLAADTSGNVATADGLFESADLMPPMIAGLAKAPTTHETGGTIRVSATVTDDIAVASVWLAVVDASNAVVANLTMACDGQGRCTVDRVFAVAGTFALLVWASDTSGNVAFVADTVSVVAGNPPVANAGPDQTISWGELVEFDGANSSDDFGIVTYRWTFTYNGTPMVLLGPKPAFRFNSTGTYVVTLTVEDIGGRQGSDLVEITVRLPPPPPGEKDGSPPWWVFLLVLILLGAVALGLVKILRRRKDAPEKDRRAEEEEPAEGDRSKAPPRG